MQSIRLHTGNGITWVLSQCATCGDVAKHALPDALAGPIACKRCGRRMDLRAATQDAMDRQQSGTSGGDMMARLVEGRAEPRRPRYFLDYD